MSGVQVKYITLSRTGNFLRSPWALNNEIKIRQWRQRVSASVSGMWLMAAQTALLFSSWYPEISVQIKKLSETLHHSSIYKQHTHNTACKISFESSFYQQAWAKQRDRYRYGNETKKHTSALLDRTGVYLPTCFA